ncbi:hypothetical protein [Planococcus rifietoensis]|uniref:hypothetical protein n=1 Tax=Planococcus rifietoensis TaxID=200991 RepID=UPI0038513952
MKQLSNFYFWASWILLGCVFTLVFFMYQERFNLQNIIDIKTLLSVLGTIFGAYFGAKIAGKYAIQAVEKQISNSERREQKREHNKLLQSLVLYRVISLKILTFSEESKEVVKKHESLAGGLNAFKADSDSLRMIKKFLTKELVQLEKIDISEISSDTFFKFTLILNNVNSIVTSVEEMIDAIDNRDQRVYIAYWDFYFLTIDSLKQNVEEIDNDLSNLKS